MKDRLTIERVEGMFATVHSDQNLSPAAAALFGGHVDERGSRQTTLTDRNGRQDERTPGGENRAFVLLAGSYSERARRLVCRGSRRGATTSQRQLRSWRLAVLGVDGEWRRVVVSRLHVKCTACTLQHRCGRLYQFFCAVHFPNLHMSGAGGESERRVDRCVFRVT